MIPADPPFSQVSIEAVLLPDGTALRRCRVSSGMLSCENLLALTEAVETCPTGEGVLLESADVRLPNLTPPEEQAWILAAGNYRRVQEKFKAQKGILLSLVTETLIGGIYLVHGMAAWHRFVYDSAVIYPALPGETFEAIFQKPYPHSTSAEAALEAGIITAITSPEMFLSDLLGQLYPQLPENTL
jgi:hypothetical protein